MQVGRYQVYASCPRSYILTYILFQLTQRQPLISGPDYLGNWNLGQVEVDVWWAYSHLGGLWVRKYLFEAMSMLIALDRTEPPCWQIIEWYVPLERSQHSALSTQLMSAAEKVLRDSPYCGNLLLRSATSYSFAMATERSVSNSVLTLIHLVKLGWLGNLGLGPSLQSRVRLTMSIVINAALK